MKRGKVLIYFLLTIIILDIILYYSVVPLLIPGEPSFMDKIKHFSAYFLLSFFIFMSTKNFKLAIFLAGTYGMLMEALQFTIPFRNFSLLDILVNFLGAALVLFLGLFKR